MTMDFQAKQIGFLCFTSLCRFVCHCDAFPENYLLLQLKVYSIRLLMPSNYCAKVGQVLVKGFSSSTFFCSVIVTLIFFVCFFFLALNLLMITQ